MNIWQRSTALQIVKIVFLTVVLLFVSYSLILRVPAAHKKATTIAPQAVNSSALYRGNAQRTGAVDEPAIRQMSGIKWTKPFGSVVHESPVYADGVLYLGSDAGRVTAIDAASGATVWSAKAKGSSVFSPVAVADGVVYIGTE